MSDDIPSDQPMRDQSSELDDLFEDDINTSNASTNPLIDHAGGSSATAIGYQDTQPAPVVEDDAEMDVHGEAHDEGTQELVEHIPDPVVSRESDRDPSPLFEPEQDPASYPRTPSPIPPDPTISSSSEPQIPLRRPVVPARASVFSRVRDMQKNLRAHRAAFQSFTPASRPNGVTDLAGADPEEVAHQQACAEFKKQESHYMNIKKQHNGHLPFRQDIEWMKIKGAEDARLRKRKRDLYTAQEGEIPDLFPQLRSQAQDQEDASDNDTYVGERSRRRRRGDQPCKQTESVSMQEAEIRSMRVALEADDDRPKKKRKVAEGQLKPPTSAKVKTSRPKNARQLPKQAVAKPANKGRRKSAKDKREIEHATRQAASLFNSNVFDQQAGMDAPDQPVLQTRRKRDALKELIASVPTPEKSDIRNDTNTLLQASKDFDGRGACKIAANSNWLVRGMKTTLKGYQVLGSAFMRRRENGLEEPRGGLMADQMGLGKTLMMLANIVNSRDAMIRTNDKGPKATLLVAGPALLTQWASEIQQHTDLGLRVIRYGARNRIDSTHANSVLGQHDLILTTYTEIMRSYPQNKPPIELQTAEEKDAWWKKTYQENRGVLHQIFFKRVVLDEAQAIKNYQGRISIACRALMASHKWALSGTPILNSLTELYPYFKFLNVPHTGSYKIFKENYCGNGQGPNAERLLVRLSQFMIRRTHADRMFNAPILKLPQATQITYWCEFNFVERSIYNIVHQRFASNINMMSRSDTLSSSYSSVLVMLLRLRQLTGHVLMLQFVMRDLLKREDIEKIKDIVREQAATTHVGQGRQILLIRKQLEAYELEEKRKAAAKAARRLAAEEKAKAAARASGQRYVEPDLDEQDSEDDMDDAPVEVPHDDGEEIGARYGRERNKSGKSFGKSYDFNPFLNSLTVGEHWRAKKEQAKCGECGERPKNPWLTACGHLLCDACYEEVLSTAAEQGRPNCTCKACGTTFAASHRLEDEDDNVGPSCGTRNRAARRKKKEKERLDREDIADDWLNLGGNDVLPSAKTTAIKSQILNWRLENPNAKIIIYTQFLAMIRILAKMCEQEEWETEQYHGKMSLTARDKAIKEFAEKPNSCVLLASLRCGGLGLNLTMASKVIMIDPWWNQASEQQAFCRVFRIGQEDETFMTRMCVRDTVDERLIEMQQNKQQEIDNVMEDRGRKTKNLDIADLMRLFGNIEEAEDGRPFIVVDNPIAVGGFHADRDHEGYSNDL